MPSSKLLRLGGLAAVLGAVLLIIVGLAQLVLNLFFLDPGAVSESAMTALYAQSALGLLGHVLLALGLIGLYIRQSEATGVFGLVSFLMIFLGMALPPGFEWGAVLTNLGWALFGVASLQARVYPRPAAILLIIGAVLTGVFNNLLVALVAGGPGDVLIYMSVGAEILGNVAIVWLGYALFSGRGVAAEHPQPAR
jgi:hypothetical protein